MPKPRNRSAGFSPEEHDLLLGLVAKYRDILTNKKTTLEINRKKQTTWKLVADEFNRIRQETERSKGEEAIIRTPQQLRIRFKNVAKGNFTTTNVSEMGKIDEPLSQFLLQPIETSSLAASHSSSIHSTPQISFVQHVSEDTSPDQIEEDETGETEEKFILQPIETFPAASSYSTPITPQTSSEPHCEDSNQDETGETEEKFILQPIETFSPASSCSTPITPQTSSNRPHCEDSNQVLKRVAKHMDQQMAEAPVSKEKFAIFCEYVSEKLCCMPQEMVPICQKLISDVLFYGETQKLGLSAHVVTE